MVQILQITEAIVAKRGDTSWGPALQPLMLCTTLHLQVKTSLLPCSREAGLEKQQPRAPPRKGCGGDMGDAVPVALSEQESPEWALATCITHLLERFNPT